MDIRVLLRNRNENVVSVCDELDLVLCASHWFWDKWASSPRLSKGNARQILQLHDIIRSYFCSIILHSGTSLSLVEVVAKKQAFLARFWGGRPCHHAS